VRNVINPAKPAILATVNMKIANIMFGIIYVL